jgi:hypothetical protein
MTGLPMGADVYGAAIMLLAIASLVAMKQR